MGEEESVVAPLGAQGLDCLVSGLPGQSKFCDVPLAELEAVGSGLRDKQMKQFKAGHKLADYCVMRCVLRGQEANEEPN
jgi:hypothetical protein